VTEGTVVVDFHAHIVGPADLAKVCAEDQKSAFFRYVVPVVERVAQFSAPVYTRFLRYLAMNFNDPLSRLAWSCCGPLGLMETLRLFKTHDLSRLIESMDANGISRTVICSLEPITRSAELIELTKAYRSRVSVFASVSRDEPDPVRYLAPLIESGAVSGIKIHPMVGGYIRGELYSATKEFVALASDRGLPVAIHTGHIPMEKLSGLTDSADVPAIEPLARDFPKCTFVLNHIGWESWRQALDLAAQYQNVMVETSWQPARIIRRAVDRLGPERVLFGSDFPLFQQEQALHEVRQALSPRELQMVVSSNALRLLRLMPARE
jgi:hypothetical protein